MKIEKKIQFVNDSIKEFEALDESNFENIEIAVHKKTLEWVKGISLATNISEKQMINNLLCMAIHIAENRDKYTEFTEQ